LKRTESDSERADMHQPEPRDDTVELDPAEPASRRPQAGAQTAAPQHNPYKGNRGLMRAWYALKYSVSGFRAAIREESAFRQELTLAGIMLPFALFLPVGGVSHALLIGSVLLVLIVELLNSSVEAAIDRISLERHELSKRAKDLGSAAVTVALTNCLCTWGFVLAPLVRRWLG
jgi:diacylglycerol kinase (ATP)